MNKLLLVLLCGLVAFPLTGAEVTFTEKEQKTLSMARQLSEAFEIIAAKVRPAVVNIQSERSGDTRVSQGSGVIVDERGYILTNDHVVRGGNTIVVRLTDGREMQAELVGESPESDLAVIRVQAPNLTVAKMGNSDVCQVGSMVLAIGNPFGLESSVSSGIISAKGRSNVVRLEIADFIQTDAAINPGNSGGPLVNLSGEIIGINSATNRESEGLSFAIPINLARTIMNGIISHKRATSSYLGVVFTPVTGQVAAAFGLEAARGALITKVIADTPAARAGLHIGDIITRYGERDIQDDNQLRTLVATTSPGQSVPIEYYRKGKKNTARVKVEALPEEVVVARRSRQLLEDLGIMQVAELTPQIRKELGYDTAAKGVLVVTVQPGSPAQEFLASGSLIYRINDSEINTPEQLHAALGKADEGCITISWRFGQYYGTRRIICKQ